MIARVVAELRRRNVFRVAGIYVVVGWLLLQVVIAIEAPLQLPAWTDTLIIVLLGVGLPVAIVLAWAFELTPEGIKAEHAVADGERITPQTARTLDYVVLAGFVLVAAMIVSDRLRPEPPVVVDPATAQPTAPHESPPAAVSAQAGDTAPPSPPAASIAVLPFADLSPGNDQQYFSDGMSEEILNVLARINGLKVASRTSAFQFRSTAAGIPAIARELGVRHVLEGGVRRSGDAIRVTAQLIDAQGDVHLWSDTFDATLNAENVFAIQDQIATAIVAALHERLGPDIAEATPASPVRTSQVEAYELFLKGRALFQARRNLGEADRLLEEALAIDPRFAEALAIRAAIHQLGGDYGAVLGDERAARRKGREFAAAALAIDPNNSLAHAITALIHFFDRQEGLGAVDYATIFAGYERSLALDPGNANALNWLGITYAHVGNNAKAVEVHTRCVEIDPALAACRSNLAGELLGLGRREEAAAVVDAAIDAGALAVGPGQMLLLAELQRRDAFLLLSLNVPALRGLRGFNALYTAMSQPGGDDRAIATELRTLLEANKGSSRVYSLLNALGDYSRPPLFVMHWIPLMKPYRESPEFREYMRASGVLDYWRQTGFPPQCRPLGAEDFACD
jgi:TolB-like protein/Tfp pilus assembly protein PilF